MIQRSLTGVTLLVPTYDQGLACFRDKLGFEVVEDTDLGGGKRWLVVAAGAAAEVRLILAEPGNETQKRALGQQTGDRVGFFLLVVGAVCEGRRAFDDWVLPAEALALLSP